MATRSNIKPIICMPLSVLSQREQNKTFCVYSLYRNSAIPSHLGAPQVAGKLAVFHPIRTEDLLDSISMLAVLEGFPS